MARSWSINVVVLVIFLAATVDSAGTSESKAIPKRRTFLEKLNNLVSLVDRGFRSVGSNVKTLYGNFDLIGALATDKLNSSVRRLELIEDRRKLVATTPHPDVTTLQPDVTTQQPDVTTPQPDVTTQQPDVTTTQPDVTTTPSATRPHLVVTTAKIAACGDRWTKYGTSFFSFCTCTRPCSFNDARKTCEEKQAELAKSTSRDLENFFVLSLNTSDYILLGGNDRDEEGTWRWPDGSLLNESYTNWGAGQPDGGTGQNCLGWYARGSNWYDMSCDYRYSAYSTSFVCEKKHL